jgi:hypothetical protein
MESERDGKPATYPLAEAKLTGMFFFSNDNFQEKKKKFCRFFSC